MTARRPVVFPDRDDVSDFGQGEAGSLGGANEVEPSKCSVVVVTIAGRAAPGLGEDSGLFVEPQRLGGHAGSAGELSDPHAGEPTT